jgi:hypothetical protein
LILTTFSFHLPCFITTEMVLYKQSFHKLLFI